MYTLNRTKHKPTNTFSKKIKNKKAFGENTYPICPEKPTSIAK